MPSPEGIITVALDYDGSLVENHVSPPRWRRGARELIVAAAAAGIRLIVHSCRCTLVGYTEAPGDSSEFWRSGRVPPDVEYSWGLREEMRGFLEAQGVSSLVEYWEGPGKPIADIYADDRAEAPDWLVLAGELGVSLGHEAGRPQAVGGPVPGGAEKPGGPGAAGAEIPVTAGAPVPAPAT